LIKQAGLTPALTLIVARQRSIYDGSFEKSVNSDVVLLEGTEDVN
jgi:hypothetical protein